jgi:hypothetical protein
MEIYVLGCTIIFSPFYCLCISSKPLTILLPWIKHKQHQNHSKPKPRIPSQFYPIKLCIHTIILYQVKVFFQRSQTPPYILSKRKLNKKLPITWFPMWFHTLNNKKETKQEITYHMVPHAISHKIIKKELNTWCTWFSHKLICESQCIMTKINYEIISLNLPL